MIYISMEIILQAGYQKYGGGKMKKVIITLLFFLIGNLLLLIDQCNMYRNELLYKIAITIVLFVYVFGYLYLLKKAGMDKVSKYNIIFQILLMISYFIMLNIYTLCFSMEATNTFISIGGIIAFTLIYILIKYISIRIKDRFKKGAKALNIFGEVICTIFFIACIVNIYIPGIVTYDPIIPQAA